MLAESVCFPDLKDAGLQNSYGAAGADFLNGMQQQVVFPRQQQPCQEPVRSRRAVAVLQSRVLQVRETDAQNAVLPK